MVPAFAKLHHEAATKAAKLPSAVGCKCTIKSMYFYIKVQIPLIINAMKPNV